MNRDRIKGEVLDQITIDGRCVLLGGCLDGATLPLLSGEKGGLYGVCRNLCMPSYTQNRQVTNREILPVTAKLSYL